LKLDLNFPEFQKDLLELEKKEALGVINTLKKIHKLSFEQIVKSPGVNVEKLKKLKTKDGAALYSIRVTKKFRAVVTIKSDYIRFVSLHPDHDTAYSPRE